MKLNKEALLLAIYFSCAAAFAGTGQIFSPAGLPQSSTQTYSPPTPDNTPTVTFPTPPLPLGGGILQSLPVSTLPLNDHIKSSGGGAQSTQSPVQTNGSVESFFQVPLVENNKKPTKNPAKDVGKLIWHTLDNLGMPMFIGKDNDLDPSLRPGYIAPPTTIPAQTTVPITPQKIPEGELEGTDVTAKEEQSIHLH